MQILRHYLGRRQTALDCSPSYPLDVHIRSDIDGLCRMRLLRLQTTPVCSWKSPDYIWTIPGAICTVFDSSPVYLLTNKKIDLKDDILELIDKDDVASRRSNTEGRTCCICGNSETFVDSKGREHWSYHRDEEGKWTGNWLCNTCRMNTKEMKKYYKDRYDDIKYISDCRNALINIKSERCKGCIGVQICATTVGVEDLNIQMDNFRYYVDLDKHTKYGFIEVKTATFNKRDGRWYFYDIHKENFDTVLLVCMDQHGPWKNVLRMYAIPSDKITTSTTITIYDTPSIRHPRWYEEFEIDAKPFNDTYHKMNINICSVLIKRQI